MISLICFFVLFNTFLTCLFNFLFVLTCFPLSYYTTYNSSPLDCSKNKEIVSKENTKIRANKLTGKTGETLFLSYFFTIFLFLFATECCVLLLMLLVWLDWSLSLNIFKDPPYLYNFIFMIPFFIVCLCLGL